MKINFISRIYKNFIIEFIDLPEEKVEKKSCIQIDNFQVYHVYKHIQMKNLIVYIGIHKNFIILSFP